MRKNLIITAPALMIVFAIMLVALMYNPQGASKDDTVLDDRNPALVTIYGMVTDDNGTPLENATIKTQSMYEGEFYATIEANGSYILAFNTTSSSLTIMANCKGHWGEQTTVYPKYHDTEFEENFTLFPNKIINLPLGIVTYVDSPDGSSNFTLNVNLTSGYYYVKEEGSTEPKVLGLPLKNMTCKVSIGSGLTMLYAKVGLFGYYIKETGEMEGMNCDSLGSVYGVPMESSGPDTSSSSWNHSTLHLAGGQEANVTLSMKNTTYEFPSGDRPNLSFDFLGRAVTFEMVNITTGNIDLATGFRVDSSIIAISLNIAPLAEGAHLYEVFTESGCVICVREVNSG
ncbi:MAG: hypothetical protein SA339_10240 [Methanomassiliicoccus sp.]|nr:hypothetical protein [Methanomassiliicoccus sp.]